MATHRVSVGDVLIGGGAAVSVQSMTNTHTEDVAATVAQILRLEACGCQIVRVAVPNMDAAHAVRDIRSKIHIPLVADVHFDFRLAMAAMENGADKLRINPGNIGGETRVRQVVDCARAHHVPIRIGVNAGSLEKDLHNSDMPVADAMIESARRHISMLERMHMDDFVLSLKASDVKTTVAANRKAAKLFSCPLHIGITETGVPEFGLVKSAAGIGALLLDGIGDTVRVSLTGDPEQEVLAGKRILQAVGIRKEGVEIISCPTCGRTRVALAQIVQEVERRLPKDGASLKVAVMGCAVNGPGEASDADIGIAFGDGNGVIFRKGVKLTSGPLPDILDRLIIETETLLLEAKAGS